MGKGRARRGTSTAPNMSQGWGGVGWDKESVSRKERIRCVGVCEGAPLNFPACPAAVQGVYSQWAGREP